MAFPAGVDIANQTFSLTAGVSSLGGLKINLPEWGPGVKNLLLAFFFALMSSTLINT